MWERVRGRDWWPWLAGAVVMVAVLMVVSAAILRQELLRVSEAVTAARDAAAAGDLDGLRHHTRRAQVSAEFAQTLADAPPLAVAARLPMVGPSVQIARTIADLGTVSVAMLDAVAAVDLDAVVPEVVDGGVDLGGLADTGAFLADLPAEGLRDVLDVLRSIPEDDLLGETIAARREAIALGENALVSIERAREAVALLPGLLGADGPRRYLLALQNSAELRGTGGFLGVLAIVEASAGRLALQPAAPDADPTGGISLRESLEDAGRFDDPVRRPADFAARYDRVDGGTFFGNVNLDPDLPTVAPVLLELYRSRVGEQLDGVVAVDVVALQQLLEPTGALAVPASVADPSGRIPDLIDPADLIRVLVVDAYDVFGGDNPQQNAFHAELGTAAFRQILSGGRDPVALGRAMGTALAERHVQIYATDPAEQHLLESLGVAGRLVAAAGADLLAVTAANAGADKTDVHVGHRISADVALTRLPGTDGVERTARVEVEVVNPLAPLDHDQHITGTSLPGRHPESRVRDALNRTWFTLWTDGRTRLVGATADGAPLPVSVSNIHGHRGFDHVLDTPSRQTRSFRMQVTGPAELTQEGDRAVYRLTLWRQAKAVPDHVDVTIRAPEGAVISDASFDGGGSGAGTGVLGTPVPLSLTSGPATVRLTGSVTADVTITVALIPGRS
jgi:hypothetical protein